LVTGGAGFIGSHVIDELLRHGYEVRALDNLSQQVHGRSRKRPAHLDSRADLMVADIRDRASVRKALIGVDAVLHLAAAVGIGQSMYEVREYTEVNNVGTAVLLEELLRSKPRRLVVASSMSIYGEGCYSDSDGFIHDGVERSLERLMSGKWDPVLNSGAFISPIETPETAEPQLSSVYALSKYDQERLCLLLGRAYDIPSVALRFFNTYGPRQLLSNPYTGVLSSFATRILNGRRPVLSEDGQQRRDFVSVYDVARACRLALESEAAVGQAINVGSGRSVTIREVAYTLTEMLGVPSLTPEVSGKHRIGDIRHCFADIRRARELLGYEPTYSLERGVKQLAAWLRHETPTDRYDAARRELEAHGLTQ
jgi:dTDP-L-rhamnose 4-epimerase